MSVTAEHADPIVLLGTSRRQRLADSIERSLKEWRKQWSADTHIAFDVDIAESLCRKPAISVGRSIAFQAEVSGRELLAIAVPTELRHELLGLSAPRVVTDGETAVAVLTEALSDLCVRLARSKPAEVVSVAPLAADKLSQAWSRYGLSVTVKTGADRVLMRARMFPELLLGILPAAAARHAEPLASRRSAIGTEVVPVQAWLGEAEVALAELANLQIGDVILLDANVNGAGRLALPDGRELAQIRLGSASGRRAVSVVGKVAGR